MKATLRQIPTKDIPAPSVSELLYGDGAWEISKELTEKQKRTQARVGLASNVVGLTAGTAALAESYQKLGQVRNDKKFGQYSGKHRVPEVPVGRFKKILSTKTAKYAVPLAAGGLALQAVNTGGDVVANRVLSRESKKKISKAVETEFDVRGEVCKMDMDKKQIFGWASIVEVNGEPVIDLQGDYMTMETVEKAAYDYVRSSRKGGNQHQRDENGPKHVSDMIESLIVTEDKKKALGLAPDTPTGWWVGFQINDDDTWQEYKTGKKTQFSIHGSGIRKDVEI